MKIKIGDKVKYNNKYDDKNNGLICIYVGGINGTTTQEKYVVIVPIEERTSLVWVDKDYVDVCLELVEVAYYTPTPKFAVGDIVYHQPSGHKCLVLEERTKELFYMVWNYERKHSCNYGESTLSKEKPEAEGEKRK